MTPGQVLAIKLDQELTRIESEIRYYEEQALQSAKGTVLYKVEVGRRLQAAKDLLPHGEFLPWAERRFGWSARHCQRHMELARNATRVSHLGGDASFRAALAALKSSVERNEQAEHDPSVIIYRIAAVIEWPADFESPDLNVLIEKATDEQAWTVRAT